MNPGEIAFLTMVIVAMSVFAITIAYASWVASGTSTTKRRQPSATEQRIPHPAGMHTAHTA